MMRELLPKLFKRAIEIAGDAQKLCARLHVDPHALQLWIDGRATPPSWILHAVIDLIVEDDLARAAQDAGVTAPVAVTAPDAATAPPPP